MWTQENRGGYDRSLLGYPSDLTDEEWAHVGPLIYLNCHEAVCREASPTVAIIDSQSVKSAEKGGVRLIRPVMTQERRSGVRSGIFSFTQGLLIHAIVHAADVQDRDGGALVMATLFGMYPFLLKLYADGGYQGPVFRRALKKILACVNIEIVKRSDQAGGFVVLPKRWVVERTFAWLGRCRRPRKGLGKSQSKGARLPAIGVHPPHAEQAMQSSVMFPDRLLGIVKLS